MNVFSVLLLRLSCCPWFKVLMDTFQKPVLNPVLMGFFYILKPHTKMTWRFSVIFPKIWCKHLNKKRTKTIHLYAGYIWKLGFFFVYCQFLLWANIVFIKLNNTVICKHIDFSTSAYMKRNMEPTYCFSPFQNKISHDAECRETWITWSVFHPTWMEKCRGIHNNAADPLPWSPPSFLPCF